MSQKTATKSQPGTGDRTISYRVPAALYERLEARAAEEGFPNLSVYLRHLAEMGLSVDFTEVKMAAPVEGLDGVVQKVRISMKKGWKPLFFRVWIDPEDGNLYIQVGHNRTLTIDRRRLPTSFPVTEEVQIDDVTFLPPSAEG